MPDNSKKLLERAEKLGRDNAALQQQLRKAKESIEAIKAGHIDAVVISNKKNLKVFTEETADKTYRILIEKMNEGAVTVNEEGTILYCNSYFARMVGLPLQKIPGTKFRKFIATLSKKAVESMLRRRKVNAVNEEADVIANDGKIIPVLMSVTGLSSGNNFVQGIILTDLTIHNITQTELRRKTGQLQEKNKELESVNSDLTAFTYVSSHDLQEPLRKIQTFATLICEEEDKNLSDTGKRYFRRMQETAKQMQALIEDLLVYSRTKSTDRKFIKTDLSIIAAEVKMDFEELIREKEATIDTANLCQINIIPFQFRQLFHNLVSNSLKFSNPGKKLHVIIKSKIAKGSTLKNKKLSPEINYCHITYSDNGIGFDPQYKDRIFQVFQRLNNKEAYPGTGIGLAICKRVVENHNGIIAATGKINKGARFDIYIPAD